MTNYLLTAVAVLGLSTALCAAPIPGEEPKGGSPAEKIKKALEQTISVEFQGQSLSGACDDLKNKLKINIVLDRMAIQNMGISPDDFPINLKLKDVKARTALKQLLGQCNLASTIDGDVLLITSEFNATEKQIRQRVSINLEGVPLEKALKDLCKETGTNIIIDPRHLAKAKEAVTLRLDDVPLEVAVRLVSELGGLRSVRQANVLFVTTKEVAAELKKEDQPANPYPYYGPVFPLFKEFGFGGGGCMPAIPNIKIEVERAVPVDPPPPPEKPD